METICETRPSNAMDKLMGRKFFSNYNIEKISDGNALIYVRKKTYLSSCSFV